MSKLIYLDNAATTQVYPEVLQEMLPYFSEVYSNPSAIYSFASESKKAVDKARTSVAELINAKTDEIYFTGVKDCVMFDCACDDVFSFGRISVCGCL